METKTIIDGKEVSRIIGTEQQSSIEIGCNAKGEKSWKVKVYDDNPADIETKLEAYIKVAQNMAGD